MTRDEVIKHLCKTVSIVYRTFDDYSKPSDGFCHECPAQKFHNWRFQHSGGTLEYVRRAVIKALVADGYLPDLSVLVVTDNGGTK